MGVNGTSGERCRLGLALTLICCDLGKGASGGTWSGGGPGQGTSCLCGHAGASKTGSSCHEPTSLLAMLPLQADGSRVQAVSCPPTLSSTSKEMGIFFWVCRETLLATPMSRCSPSRNGLCACRDACSEESTRPVAGEIPRSQMTGSSGDRYFIDTSRGPTVCGLACAHAMNFQHRAWKLPLPFVHAGLTCGFAEKQAGLALPGQMRRRARSQ